MKGKKINIIDNITKAISILNQTDEYLDSLSTRLSECDKLETDYRHLIEFEPVEKINLKQLYKDMQNNFVNRRNIKKDMDIGRNLTTNIAKLCNIDNRQFLIQTLKNVESKNDGLEYTNRILNDNQIKRIIIKKRDRPKKLKEGA